MTITSTSNQNIQTSDVQSVIDAIYKNYNDALQIIKQIESAEADINTAAGVVADKQKIIDDLEKQIGKFEDALAALLAFAALNYWNPAGWAAAAAAAGIAIKIGVLEKQLSDVKKDQQTVINSIKDLTDKIKALTGELSGKSSLFKPLCDAINQLLDQFNAALHSMSQYLSGDSMQQDVKVLNESLNVFVSALENKAKEIVDGQLINQGDGDIMALAADMIANESQEAGLLNGLSRELTQDTQFYSDISGKAEGDKHTTRWYNYALRAGTTCEKTKADAAEMQHSKDMQSLIAGVRGNLLSESASLTPGLEQISAIIHKVLKEIKEILSDTTLTPSVKQKKIVKLFVIIMSYLNLIQAYASQYKSQQDQEQSEATLDTQKAEVDRAVLNSKMLRKDLEYANNMKIFMAITEAVVGVAMAAMTVVTAGSTLAIACAVMACLFAAVAIVDLGMTLAGKTGSMEMATEALTRLFQKTGGSELGCKIGADVFISGLEIALTLGSAAIVKFALESEEKILTTTVMIALRAMMEKASAAESARLIDTLSPMGKLGMSEAEAILAAQDELAVSTAIRNTVEAAAKAAAEKVFKQFMNKGISQLIPSLIKTGPRQLMEKAAKEAVETAARESADVLISTGKVGQLSDLITNQLQAIATKVSTDSAARVLGTTAEKITALLNEEDWIPAKKIPKAKQAARAVSVGGYAIGSTNLLADIATSIQKTAVDKNLKGRADDATFEYLLMGIQLVQQLLQIVAMGVANMSNVLSVLNDGSKLAMVQTASTLFGTAGNVFGSGGSAEAQLAQGETMAAQINNKTASDMMNLIATQINKLAATQRKVEIDQQARSAESTYKLSSHLWENGNIIAEVLSGRAV